MEGKICWEYVVEDFATYEGLGAEELEGIFEYPANAVFRAMKYTADEVPWLEARVNGESEGEGRSLCVVS